MGKTLVSKNWPCMWDIICKQEKSSGSLFNTWEHSNVGRKDLALPSCKARASLHSRVVRCGNSTLHYWTQLYGAFQQGLAQTTGETRRGLMPGCPDYEQKKVESVCIVLHGNTGYLHTYLETYVCVKIPCVMSVENLWLYSEIIQHIQKVFFAKAWTVFLYVYTILHPCGPKLHMFVQSNVPLGVRGSPWEGGAARRGGRWAERERRPGLWAEMLSDCSGDSHSMQGRRRWSGRLFLGCSAAAMEGTQR